MRAVLAVVGVIVLYICCVGIFSPVCGFEFKKPAGYRCRQGCVYV